MVETIMRDDQEFNVRFVDIVKANPCLFDSTREDYNLSHVQERAWAEIAKQVGEQATIADCKGRWKNLRGSYTKHLKKYKQSGSWVSTARPYYLAEHMQFILPFTKSRQAKGNIEPPTNEHPASLHDEASTEGLDTQSIEESTDRDGKDQTDDKDQLFCEEAHCLVETKSLTGDKEQPTPSCWKQRKQVQQPFAEQKSKRSKIDVSSCTLEAVNQSALEYFEKKQMPLMSVKDDADAHFLISLLPDLKKMTDHQKQKFKVEMLNFAGQILPSQRSTTPSALPMHLIIENDPTKITQGPPDHIDTFLAGITSTIKKLNPYNQHIAKGKIFNVVHELESQELCTNSGSCVSSEYSQQD